MMDFGGTRITLRLSARGVPHTLVEYEGHTFSICFMKKKKDGKVIRHNEEGAGQMYRIWEYNTQEKLLDVELSPKGTINLAFVLSGLVEKLKARDPQPFTS